MNTDVTAETKAAALTWSEVAKPCPDCRYDHTYAETPFGRFLLTWKSWKDFPGYGFDETPWGEVCYEGWNSIEEAKVWAETKMVELCEEFLSRRSKL